MEKNTEAYSRDWKIEQINKMLGIIKDHEKEYGDQTTKLIIMRVFTLSATVKDLAEVCGLTNYLHNPEDIDELFTGMRMISTHIKDKQKLLNQKTFYSADIIEHRESEYELEYSDTYIVKTIKIGDEFETTVSLGDTTYYVALNKTNQTAYQSHEYWITRVQLVGYDCPDCKFSDLWPAPKIVRRKSL